MSDGIDRIEIPADWRITFGPVIGVAGKAAYGSGNVLRVWEGKDHQRGLWSNVMSFRDLSIVRLVAAVRKYGTEEWYADDNNTWKGDNADLVEKGWKPDTEVNFDTPPFVPDDSVAYPKRMR